MLTGIDGEGFVDKLRKRVCQLQEETAEGGRVYESREETDLLAYIFPSPISIISLPIMHPMTRICDPALRGTDGLHGWHLSCEACADC
jgi:hypothetical protein